MLGSCRANKRRKNREGEWYEAPCDCCCFLSAEMVAEANEQFAATQEARELAENEKKKKRHVPKKRKKGTVGAMFGDPAAEKNEGEAFD